MLLFPLPFLTAILLVSLLLYLALKNNRGVPLLTFVTIGCYAVQTTLIGIKWGITSLPPIIMVSLATVLPALTWITMNDLSGHLDRAAKRSIFFLVATLIVIVNIAAALQYDELLDFISTAQYIIFGAWLIRQARNRNLGRSLHMMIPTARAFLLAGTIMLASASVDVAVAADTVLNSRRLSPALVGYSNLLLLLLLLAMFLRNSLGGVAADAATPIAVLSPQRLRDELNHDARYRSILERLESEMNERHLYRNENLTLSRIASKIQVPSRHISSAVKTMCAMGVPQYVNTFRVRDACRMLLETNVPVTEIAFTVGFTTKSNFNREFMRIMGVSPSAWRTKSLAVERSRPRLNGLSQRPGG